MQNEIFESVFKFSPIGIALVSPEGKWLKVNKATLNLLGYSEDELLTIDFLQITHPEDLKQDLNNVADLLNGKIESYQMEKRYFHKNGHIIHALLSVSLIRDQDAKPQFFISQIMDISELKKTQAKLQTNSKLMALGEMAAGIAHEINNPLTIINLHTTALEHLVREPEINREMMSNFTNKITATVKRISSTVSSLRKFSVDNNRFDSFEKTKMTSILEDSIGLCKEKFKSAGVVLNVSVPNDLELECNPFDISQVLVNLINNAYFAIKSETEKVISISVVEIQNMAVISVMDSGPGIPANIRDKLLNPFFTTKPIGQGTGLGLSISCSIVKSHQGELFLDESSANTNFVVKLPLKQDKFALKSQPMLDS